MHYPLLKGMYLILTLQVPLTLPSVSYKTDSVFLKEDTQKCVLTNTCPMACISQYTPTPWQTETIVYRRRLTGQLEWPGGLWKF